MFVPCRKKKMPIKFVFSAKSEWVGNLFWNGNGLRKYFLSKGSTVCLSLHW